MQETQVQCLGREDLLEKEMATHSSILAWKIPWTEEPGGLQSMGSQRAGHNCMTNTHTQTSQMVLWVKNPPAVQELQELRFDPWVRKISWRRAWQPTPVFLPGESMDRGAWRAIIHRVRMSQTRLSDLPTTTLSSTRSHDLVSNSFCHLRVWLNQGSLIFHLFLIPIPTAFFPL